MKPFLFAVLLISPAFADSDFTIEQVLSAPVPSDLVASPKGDAIAWVQNASGVRNIWAARAPAYQARVITHFTEDDGLEINDLAFRPDSSAVVFTRGGEPNGRGEFPNPRSNPVGAQQEIWIASLAGEAHRLASGHEPAVAPDNSAIAWLAGDQIWWMRLNANDPAAKPEQLFHERGKAHEVSWSADSTRIAFVSKREDHAIVGVYNLRAKSLLWMDPSVDTDQSVTWSPDGKQIAFIRLPAAPSEFEYGPHREGTPWTIRVSSAATGKGAAVWQANEGVGSVYRELGSDRQLFWTANRQIVFPWEGDGWLHLYPAPVIGMVFDVPTSPELAVTSRIFLDPLTPGDFEVDQVAASADRRSLVFSSNQGDTDRRHLWRVAPAGGQPVQLTRGKGIEWAPVSLSDGRIAFFHSDARKSPRAALLDASGTIRDLAPQTVPQSFPEKSLVEPQAVTFRAADGLELHGQLFVPTDDTGKSQAIVFFHGGSRRQMLLGWHYMEYYNRTYGFNQFLANQGYIVLSVNYRSGTGYGMEFREATGFGASGGSEDNDILGAQRYLASRADVDAGRIGVWGGSYGGYLAALALARHSDLFKAGVDFHGIHDWNLEIDRYPGNAGSKTELAKTAFESSPLASIKTWHSPVLLVQGDDDRNVAFGQSVYIAEALRKQDVPFEQIIFPDEIHDFLVFSHWLEAYRAAETFFGRYLKP